MGIIDAIKGLAPRLNVLLNDNSVIEEIFIKEGSLGKRLFRKSVIW